jgi:hypothetical protein
MVLLLEPNTNTRLIWHWTQFNTKVSNVDIQTGPYEFWYDMGVKENMLLMQISVDCSLFPLYPDEIACMHARTNIYKHT